MKFINANSFTGNPGVWATRPSSGNERHLAGLSSLKIFDWSSFRAKKNFS
jgi:hypothetical protein